MLRKTETYWLAQIWEQNSEEKWSKLNKDACSVCWNFPLFHDGTRLCICHTAAGKTSLTPSRNVTSSTSGRSMWEKQTHASKRGLKFQGGICKSHPSCLPGTQMGLWGPLESVLGQRHGACPPHWRRWKEHCYHGKMVTRNLSDMK